MSYFSKKRCTVCPRNLDLCFHLTLIKLSISNESQGLGLLSWGGQLTRKSHSSMDLISGFAEQSSNSLFLNKITRRVLINKLSFKDRDRIFHYSSMIQTRFGGSENLSMEGEFVEGKNRSATNTDQSVEFPQMVQSWNFRDFGQSSTPLIGEMVGYCENPRPRRPGVPVGGDSVVALEIDFEKKKSRQRACEMICLSGKAHEVIASLGGLVK
ncbi:hypothetical protein LguiB_010634 [Lonicera macranthoides]